jgi:hypothetical protein
MRFIVIILLSFTLTGCVGILYNRGIQEDYDHPRLKPAKGTVEYHDAGHYSQSDNKWVVDPYVPYTREDVLKLWGEPTSRNTLPNGHELWTYNHSLAWHGFVPVIIIPLPLPFFLPFGFRKTYLEFDEQYLVKATMEDSTLGGFVCGYVISDEKAGPGCMR